MLKIQKKSGLEDEHGHFQIRVSHRKQNGNKQAHYTFKCGCCPEKLEVYYDDKYGGLEINGVEGSVENWRDLLLPLLGIKETETGFEDIHPLFSLRKKYQHVGN